MVAREGSAPSTSGCRPDMMLFQHRALMNEIVAGDGLAPSRPPSKGGVLLLDDPAGKNGAGGSCNLTIPD